MNQNRAVPQPNLSPHIRDLDGNAVCMLHEVSLEEGFLLLFPSSPVSINPAMLQTVLSYKRLLKRRKGGRRIGTSQQIYVSISRVNLGTRNSRVISFSLQPIYPGEKASSTY